MSRGRIAVVLNATSGHGAAPKAAERLKEIFAEAGREARITLATGGSEINAAMRRAVEAGCETLVDHFAKDLGIPLDLDEAAKVVLEGVVCKVDVGEVNGQIFLNNSSLGVYPAVVRLREKYRATLRGKWIAALWAGLTVLRRSPFMTCGSPWRERRSSGARRWYWWRTTNTAWPVSMQGHASLSLGGASPCTC